MAHLAERNKMKNRIFILAHPDDEVFCLPYLFQEKYRNYFVYLTSGKLPNQSTRTSEIRQVELGKSLELLGTQTYVEQIFLKNVTQDSILHEEVNSDLLLEVFTCIESKNISECCTMKFEGGHQDHDITNVVARLLSAKKDIIFREFAMYSASNRKIFNFKINTKASSGTKLKFQRMRVVYFALITMRIYKSQWRTWIGLAVPLVCSYSFGTWREGFANPNTAITFPNVALYENRRKATVQEVRDAIYRLQLMAKTL